jgi:hypothetical protein
MVRDEVIPRLLGHVSETNGTADGFQAAREAGQCRGEPAQAHQEPTENGAVVLAVIGR